MTYARKPLVVLILIFVPKLAGWLAGSASMPALICMPLNLRCAYAQLCRKSSDILQGIMLVRMRAKWLETASCLACSGGGGGEGGGHSCKFVHGSTSQLLGLSQWGTCFEIKCPMGLYRGYFWNSLLYTKQR